MTDTTKHHHGTAANALGGRTARACDSCIRRRARWYCAADDAFLCQLCDSSVHSANPLARRHHRLRLTTTATTAPSWHHGFTRKPRTPRPHSKHPPPKPGPLVPDLDLDTHTDEEQTLLYQVPVFDAQLNCGGFHTSEAELAEFAADVESLLGFDDDGEQFCMERMGIVDEGSCELADVKMEPGGAGEAGAEGDLETEFSGDGLEIDFDYGSPEKMVDDIEERRLILRLDYDGVIMAWSGRGCSPWSDGRRPEVKIEECWPELMGNWGVGGEGPGQYGEVGHVAMAAGDVGREARVTRYREKRRTRLFSKKIRYEVRKLNAEKRPRMKGRFVKRAAYLPATAAAGFSY